MADVSTPEETRAELHKVKRMLYLLCKNVEDTGNMCVRNGALMNGVQVSELITEVKGLEAWWNKNK